VPLSSKERSSSSAGLKRGKEERTISPLERGGQNLSKIAREKELIADREGKRLKSPERKEEKGRG